MRIKKSAKVKFAATLLLLASGQSAHAQGQSGLSVKSAGAIVNTKKIESRGPVEMESKESIKNGTPTNKSSIKSTGSVNLKAPGVYNSGTIQAGGAVNINTGNLVNNGTISAPAGEVNITGHGDKPLQLDNKNGSITGKSINIKSQGKPVTLEGGSTHTAK